MHILFVFNVLDKQVNQDHLLVDILWMLVRDSAVRCYHHELDGVSFCMLLAGEKRLDFVSQNTFIVLVNDEFMLQKYEFISMTQKKSAVS